MSGCFSVIGFLRVGIRAGFGPFANTNTSLFSLPAYDVPYPKIPAFYDELAQSDEELTIIEVPEWLARLEPRLAALERDEPAVNAEPSEPETPKTDDPPAKQQELF